MSDWWKGAVIYQIYPRSFLDTSGNGVGDIKGITRKLDYISDLGVDAIWLSPIFTSPMKDMGYDVSDYKNIDPLFGNLKDFDDLIREAHNKNLKVIIDQVLSHSSDKMPFFKKAKRARIHQNLIGMYGPIQKKMALLPIIGYQCLEAQRGNGSLLEISITCITFYLVSQISIFTIWRCRIGY